MNEIEIFDLDHQGRGIGKINNKIAFITNALPGEVIKYNILIEKKDYIEAEVIEYIKKSNKRIEEKCKYNCGGCNLLHIEYEDQLKYKEEKIKSIINKFTNIKTNIKPIIRSNNIFNYRNKITFHCDKKIGLYKQKTNEIIEINNCMLADNKINNLLNEIKRLKIEDKNEITIRATTNETMIITEKYINNIESINATTIICNNKIIKGNAFIKEELNNNKFIITKDSFFQINKEQTINLYNKIVEYANLNGSENVLDLYCGTGTIGIYLSKKANSVIGIELNKNAIEAANKNKDLNNIKNIRFICGDAKDKIKIIENKIDVLIVDPPRSGLYKGMIEDIIKINPQKIIYVSCNPITLARDLNDLNNNYKVLEIQPIDMFPNTYHCESITVLERR